MKPAEQQIAERIAATNDRRVSVSRETIDTPADFARWVDNIAQDDFDVGRVIFSAIRHFDPTDEDLGVAVRILANQRGS